MKLRIRSKELAQSLKSFQNQTSFELMLSSSSKRSLAGLEKKLQRMFGVNSFKCYKNRSGRVLVINNLKINNKKDMFDFFK
jgi:hypothetical protein